MLKLDANLILAGLIASLPALIASVYGLLKARADAKREAREADAVLKKADSEAAGELTDTALSLLIPLREENARFLVRIRYLERGCRILIRQLKSAGIEPCFDPTNGANLDEGQGHPTIPLSGDKPATAPKTTPKRPHRP